MRIFYLDDLRNPPMAKPGESFIVLRAAQEFRVWILKHGLPDGISFDHDLGEESNGSGMDCAKWLVKYCLDNNVELPNWMVHSAKPPGRENIAGLL